MKFRILLISMLVAVSAVLLAVPTFAQSEASITVTEAEINDSFRMSNPIRVRVSDVTVDLVPDAVEVSATYSLRFRANAGVTSTVVPNIEDGRVIWEVTSVQTADGNLSDELIQQINDSVGSAWRFYLRTQYEGNFTDVIITDEDITLYLGDPAPPEENAAANGDDNAGNGDAGNDDAGNGDAGNDDAGNDDAGNGDAGNDDADNDDDDGNGDAARGSYTLTESEINNSFRVNSPARIRVSNINVNLVPGTAQVTASYNFRGGSADVTSTATPSVSGGRIIWTVTSVQTGGEPISDALLQQINDSVSSAWRNYARGQHDGRFTDVIVTENDITFYFGSV